MKWQQQHSFLSVIFEFLPKTTEQMKRCCWCDKDNAAKAKYLNTANSILWRFAADFVLMAKGTLTCRPEFYSWALEMQFKRNQHFLNAFDMCKSQIHLETSNKTDSKIYQGKVIKVNRETHRARASNTQAYILPFPLPLYTHTFPPSAFGTNVQKSISSDRDNICLLFKQ